jgi:hypothetical protein
MFTKHAIKIRNELRRHGDTAASGNRKQHSQMCWPIDYRRG